MKLYYKVELFSKDSEGSVILTETGSKIDAINYASKVAEFLGMPRSMTFVFSARWAKRGISIAVSENTK